MAKTHKHFPKLDQNTKCKKVSRSVGVLYDAQKRTKEKSPDLLGEFLLQRHTFEAIARKFEFSDDEQIRLKIAAWDYSRRGRKNIYVEISAPYEPIQKQR